MANDLNKVMIIGRLTRDPELANTMAGKSYCKLSIANGSSYKTEAGEKKEETSFFNCIAWGRQAEIINQYCKKGKQVAIEGRLQQQTWQDQQTGQNRSTVNIVIDRLQMLGDPGAGRQEGYSQAHSGGSGTGGHGGGGYQPSAPGPSYDDPGAIPDDDLPF